MRGIFTIALALLMGFSYGQVDTTQYKFGKRRIIIINSDGDTTTDNWDDWDDFDIEDTSENNDYVEAIGQFQIGANGYMMPDNSLNLPSELAMMELDYAKSRSVAFNMMWYVSPMDESRLYISPGIGLDIKSYKFKNSISIGTQNDTVVFAADTVTAYEKYKLRATYLQVPIIVGARIGSGDTQLHLQAGVIGGYNIGSLVKTRVETDGTKYKNKIKDDFNLNPFKLSATARIGIGDFGFFANYGLTSLFQKNKSPEIIPFTVGVQFGGF